MAEYIKVPAGVYDMVTRCMEQEFPDHVAIRYVAEDGKTVVEKKYREYAQDIRRMTAYLKAEVPDIKGRRIVLLSRNCYEFCVASFGIILAGGVLVTLNQKKTWDELEYELGLVEPALILNDGIDYGCRAELEAAYGPKLRPMDCYKDTAPGELTNCVGHDDLMMLMFTSGTTGRSKGVMLSERNMCASLHTYSEVAENWITNRLPAGQKLPLSHMTLLPLFHMACFVCVMSYPPAGWTLNLCGDIRDFYRDLGLMHSDVMASAPMLVETIYNDMKRGRVSRLNGLWDLCCSSAALDPRMLLELAQNGFVVNQCYGMTETFGDGILNFTQVEKHMSAVGKPDDPNFMLEGLNRFPAGMELGVSYCYFPLEPLSDDPLFAAVLEGVQYFQKTRVCEQKHLDQLEKTTADQKQTIEALQKNLSELHQANAELSARSKAYESSLENILSSSSWKLTLPLRRLLGLFHRSH